MFYCCPFTAVQPLLEEGTCHTLAALATSLACIPCLIHWCDNVARRRALGFLLRLSRTHSYTSKGGCTWDCFEWRVCSADRPDLLGSRSTAPQKGYAGALFVRVINMSQGIRVLELGTNDRPPAAHTASRSDYPVHWAQLGFYWLCLRQMIRSRCHLSDSLQVTLPRLSQD